MTDLYTDDEIIEYLRSEQVNPEHQFDPDLRAFIDIKSGLTTLQSSKAQDTIATILESDIQKGRAAIDRILKATAAELHCKAFVMDCLRQFGTCSYHWPSDGEYEGSLTNSRFGTLQYPSEFCGLLMMAGRSKPEKIAEVGVAHGCSSYFAAAYFYRCNPKAKYLLIDIENTLLDYDYYAGILPISHDIPSTVLTYQGQAFDLVFIDADHSYRGVRMDYQAIGQYAKICALHDIRATRYDAEDGGIMRFWTELKQAKRDTHNVYEIIHSETPWMGIGVIEVA
jgi:predicted O-methyltransferase YrrM